MTGFGESSSRSDKLALTVEVRAVNNRHLKITVRGSEPYPMLEPELEKVVRKHIRRGTILIHIRADRVADTLDGGVHADLLVSYIQQVHTICSAAGHPENADSILSQVLALPGVVSDAGRMGRPDDEEWQLAERTLEQALKNLDQMRREEGRAMAEDLLGQRQAIAEQLDRIRGSIPAATSAYRTRLKDRMTHILSEFNVTITEDNLLREVALFADRSDVAEEVMRLGSHLDQFEEVIRKESDSPGRKLEFLTQEMNRETNTIGSKAGDVAISRHVVEIKAIIEKIREMVQNVE
jgi:uncharacterized protein (TIGR00255 family)